WHAAALRGKGGKTSISQTYRFLRMVMNTAVRENVIARNPCQIPGAGVVKAAERPVATPRRSSPWSTRSPPVPHCRPDRRVVRSASWGDRRSAHRGC
ncbi:hypothetical protein ACFQZ4_54630, partial [Catellatospora coxensis]